MIAEGTARGMNKGITMDIPMDIRTLLPRDKRTIIVGPTDMTIIRKAYTMVANAATTQDIVREERAITTIITITTRARPASIRVITLAWIQKPILFIFSKRSFRAR
jgi:hypothetical protein